MSKAKTQTKAPVKTSDKKRPNKTYINLMAEFRGHMTGNEKLQLKTLEVKNALQKINNRAMSESKDTEFNSKEVKDLIKLVNSFVKEVGNILK